MREAVRPYALTTTTTGTTPVELAFSSTAGSAIGANYVVVKCDGGPNEFFSVHLSGLVGGPSVADQETAADIAAADSTSAIRGGFAPCEGGVVTFSIPSNEPCTGIKITATGGTNRYFVQYGVVNVANGRADSIRDRGV